MKILFVCSGNTCRSPMAQVIFANICKKNKQKSVKVEGAGTHTELGLPQNAKGVLALVECGEKLGSKQITSRKFSHDLIKKFDHIVCMTYEHKIWIGDCPNVYTLDVDIDDPYGGTLDGYVKTCRQLQIELQKLYHTIFESDELWIRERRDHDETDSVGE